MKKKFFSKLLMGALLVATVSSYVSCKDYDDDIANLQSQIAAQEQAHALKTELESAKSEAAANLAAAEARLQALIDGKASSADLSAAKAELQSAIADVRAIAEQAGTDVATALNNAAAAQAAAEGAQSTADAALEAAQAADAKITAAVEAATTEITAALEAKANQADVDAAIASVNTQLAALAAAQENLTTAEDLASAVDELERKIQAVSDAADLTPYVARLTALEEGIGALWSAVTSVSLYVTNAYTEDGYVNHRLLPITFLNVTEIATVNFPADEDKELADRQLSFTEDTKVVRTVDTIYVRVSPVTAQLDASMVKLINSQGAPISEELIESIEVAPYEKLLTKTRADNKNGLWQITFKLKDNYSSEKFEEVAGAVNKEVLFAVAVNNKKESAADRFVVSEYDLYLREGKVEHAYDFKVNDTWINQIHNRYKQTEEQKIWTDGTANSTIIPELVWNDNTKPAVKAVTGRDGNATDRGNNGFDNRQSRQLLNVDVDQDITIEFPEVYNANNKTEQLIRGFFVTLDYDFAIESGNSEANAWIGYEYDKVGVVYNDENGVRKVKEPAYLFEGNKGTIKIKKLTIKGDIVGFRVYAVNYDGTLYDPDGRAFYVYVGEKAENKTIPFDITVTDANGNTSSAKDVTDYFGDLYWSFEWAEDAKVWNGNNGFDTYRSGTMSMISTLFTFAYKNKNGNTVTPTYYQGYADLSEVTSMTAKINLPKYLIDNETYTIVAIGRQRVGDNLTDEVARIIITIKKTMPDQKKLPSAFTPKEGQKDQIKPLHVYVKPVDSAGNDAWGTTNNAQDIMPFNLVDIFAGLAGDENYKIEILDGTLDSNGEDADLELTWTPGGNNNNGSYTIPQFSNKKVGGTYNVNITYTYNGISLTVDEDNENLAVQEPYEVSERNPYDFTVEYDNALDLERLVVADTKHWQYQATNGVADYAPNKSDEADKIDKLKTAYFTVEYGKQSTFDYAKSIFWDQEDETVTKYLSLLADTYDEKAGLPVGWCKDHYDASLADLLGDGIVTVTKIEMDTAGKNYFSVAQDGTTVTLTPIMNEDDTVVLDPKGVTIKVNITIKDVFGNKTKTIAVPLTLVKTAV